MLSLLATRSAFRNAYTQASRTVLTRTQPVSTTGVVTGAIPHVALRALSMTAATQSPTAKEGDSKATKEKKTAASAKVGAVKATTAKTPKSSTTTTRKATKTTTTAKKAAVPKKKKAAPKPKPKPKKVKVVKPKPVGKCP
jgi:outer membrane biosynthesis protein TonB